MGIENKLIILEPNGSHNYNCSIKPINIHVIMKSKGGTLMLIILLTTNILIFLLSQFSVDEDLRLQVAYLGIEFINKVCDKVLTTILFRYA